MSSVLDRLPSSSSAYRARIIANLDQLDALHNQWPTGESEYAGPTEQFIWTRTCAAAFSRGKTLHAIAIEDDAGLAAVAPLGMQKAGGLRRLVALGAGELHEPTGFVARDEHAHKGLVGALLRLRIPFVLPRVLSDSASTAILKRACRGRAVVIERPRSSCPFIPLDESWREPLEHLNAGRRSDLRRARRKAEKLGPVTTEIVRPRIEDLEKHFETVLRIEANSWKGEAGTALACDPLRAAFFQRYTRAACEEGTLRLAFLSIAGQAAAMQLAVEQGSGFWLLKIGYDAQFSACSPGQLLMCDTIKYAAERGLRTYEFMGRADDWTGVWTQCERTCSSLQVYPWGAHGAAGIGVDLAGALVRRWRRS